MDAILQHIVELANAPTEVIISSDQQKAMAMTEDDAATLATNLQNQSPRALPFQSDEISAITGSTRTSKAECFADKKVEEISRQHVLALADSQRKTKALERRLSFFDSSHKKLCISDDSPRRRGHEGWVD
mmetsp:Transcript_27749/g.41146  ORF Transcript_27749/g.41146 Transcript_27749/m.41146 type:complete len:130 (-) Transcript_27749:1219-1608(-)